MRSAIIAALVGVAVALPYTETIHNTQVVTITSCGAEVTDCPGKKTSSAPAKVTTTTCTEEYKKTTVPAPPVYVTSSVPAPPVYVTSSAPAPPVYVTSSIPAPPVVKSSSSSAAAVTSSAPAPPPYQATSIPAPPKSSSTAAVVTSSAPAPPPYVYSTGVVTKSTPIGSAASSVTKPASYGTISTGVPPVTKTTSAYWSKTTSPATYTGAASHAQAAGFVLGAGAMAAFFL